MCKVLQRKEYIYLTGGSGTENAGALPDITVYANKRMGFVRTFKTQVTITWDYTNPTINNIIVNEVKPKDIYFDDSNIVFVVDGEIPTLPSSLYDTVDGYHFKVQNTVPSGMTKCKYVYKDLVKVYG